MILDMCLDLGQPIMRETWPAGEPHTLVYVFAVMGTVEVDVDFL